MVIKKQVICVIRGGLTLCEEIREEQRLTQAKEVPCGGTADVVDPAGTSTRGNGFTGRVGAKWTVVGGKPSIAGGARLCVEI